jgi:hypothetical protein
LQSAKLDLVRRLLLRKSVDLSFDFGDVCNRLCKALLQILLTLLTLLLTRLLQLLYTPLHPLQLLPRLFRTSIVLHSSSQRNGLSVGRPALS